MQLDMSLFSNPAKTNAAVPSMSDLYIFPHWFFTQLLVKQGATQCYQAF